MPNPCPLRPPPPAFLEGTNRNERPGGNKNGIKGQEEEEEEEGGGGQEGWWEAEGERKNESWDNGWKKDGMNGQNVEHRVWNQGMTGIAVDKMKVWKVDSA